MPNLLPNQIYQQIKARVLALPTTQFPKISLTIPERSLMVSRLLLSHPTFLYSFLLGFLAMGIGIVSVDVHHNLGELQKVQSQRQMVERQVLQWERVVGKYATYRDGYYQLAVLEYQLGNTIRAGEYITKALVIDPEFAAGKAFAGELMK